MGYLEMRYGEAMENTIMVIGFTLLFILALIKYKDSIISMIATLNKPEKSSENSTVKINESQEKYLNNSKLGYLTSFKYFFYVSLPIWNILYAYWFYTYSENPYFDFWSGISLLYLFGWVTVNATMISTILIISFLEENSTSNQ